MGPDWKWDRWQDIAQDEEIPGPETVDPYNCPHELRPGIASSFATVLQLGKHYMGRNGLLLWYSLEDQHGTKNDR
eukprot:8996281-Ditylum_brightwellii.AAC.2